MFLKRVTFPSIRYFAQAIAIALCYFIASSPFYATVPTDLLSNTIYPATGLAIAASLIFKKTGLIASIVGLFLVCTYYLSTSLPLSLNIFIARASELVLAYFLLSKFTTPYFSTIRSVIIFLSVLCLSSALGACIGCFTFFFNDAPQLNLTLWASWTLSTLIGGLIITPAILFFSTDNINYPTKGKDSERFIFSIILLAICGLIFSPVGNLGESHVSIAYIFFPLAIWCTQRFSFLATLCFTFFVALAAYLGTQSGYGPFVTDSLNNNLLQGFITTLSLSSLLLSASQNEKQRVTQGLLEVNAKLEEKVQIRTEDLSFLNQELGKEVEAHKKTIEALHTLLHGSALVSQQQLTRLYVDKLAKLFGTQYAFAGIFSSSDKSVIQTLAVRSGDGFESNFQYPLKGTPCDDVLNGRLEFINRNCSTLYPDDIILAQMGVESYFGSPIISPTGETLGILVIMDIKAMQLQHGSREILSLFSNRLAIELDRKESEEEKRLAETVFKSSAQCIAISDKNANILRVNPAFERVTGYCNEELQGKNFRILKSGKHGLEFYKSLWKKIIDNGYWQGEVWNKRKSGEVFPAWLTISNVQDNGDTLHFVSIFSDITEKKVSEEHIYQLAHYDSLTGLYNRHAFHIKLQNAILACHSTNTPLAIFYLDLDDFKIINDASGHAAGDMLLKTTAERLRTIVRAEDIVSRFGGDEFVILVANYNVQADLHTIAKKIVEEITRTVSIDHSQVSVTASIGISTYPEHGEDAETLLNNADMAMYQAKKNGRNNFHFYTHTLGLNAQKRLLLEKQLRRAVENDELELYYQPQIDAKSQGLIGCEALLRWRHKDKGIILPKHFIPLAEENGSICTIGNWVIEEACRQQYRWNKDHNIPIKISINISAKQFSQKNLHKIISNAITSNHAKPELLELEITESTIIENIEETQKTLKQLKAMGVHLSIDDFGTGYSSLAYLKTFPIDRLKIDKSFIQDITQDNGDADIVKATVTLGKSLKMSVIAEGVETEQQLKFLSESGCHEIQGNYFSPPRTAEEISAFIREHETT